MKIEAASAALSFDVSRRDAIQVGWSADRVQRTMGIPTNVTTGYGSHGPEEVWHYGAFAIKLARGSVVEVGAI